MQRIAGTKSDYIRLVCKYLNKKEELKTKYKRGDPEYARIIKNVDTRLSTWRAAIRRIDKRTEVINQLNNTVQYIYGFSMYKSVKHWREPNAHRWLVRRMFCKYVLEYGITGLQGAELSSYLGWKEPSTATRKRMEMNKLIKTDDDIRNQWHTFKRKMEKQLPQQQRA